MNRLTLPRLQVPGSAEVVSSSTTVTPTFTSPTQPTRIGGLPPLRAVGGTSLNPSVGPRNNSLLQSATLAPKTTRTFTQTTREVVRQTTPEEVSEEVYSEEEEEDEEEEAISSPIASPPRALPPVTPVTKTTITTTTTGAPRGLARLGLPSPKDVRTVAPTTTGRTLSKTVTTTTTKAAPRTRQPRTTTRVSPTTETRRVSSITATVEPRLDLVTLQIMAKILDLPPSNDRRDLVSRIMDVLSNQE